MHFESIISIFNLILTLLNYTLANISDNVDSSKETEKSDHIVFNAGDFRLKKYNDIWEKAQRLLNLNDQRKLYKEMLKYDKSSLSVKHDIAEGRKGSLDEMKMLDKKLIKLLQNYKLFDLADKTKKTLDLGEVSDPRFAEHKHLGDTIIFEDKNLLKLWHEAKSAGYTDEELEDLREEFVHYAQRQKDHKEKMSSHYNEAMNSVHRDDNTETSTYDTNRKLKGENKMLNEQFSKLVEKVEDEKKRSANGQLRNTKSKTLWEKALKSGTFNDQQLDDLFMELKHFDDKLDKLRAFEDDIADTKFKMNKITKSEHGKFDEYAIMDRKLKDYEKKVHKLEAFLADKVEL